MQDEPIFKETFNYLSVHTHLCRCTIYQLLNVRGVFHLAFYRSWLAMSLLWYHRQRFWYQSTEILPRPWFLTNIRILATRTAKKIPARPAASPSPFFVGSCCKDVESGLPHKKWRHRKVFVICFFNFLLKPSLLSAIFVETVRKLNPNRVDLASEWTVTKLCTVLNVECEMH